MDQIPKMIMVAIALIVTFTVVIALSVFAAVYHAGELAGIKQAEHGPAACECNYQREAED